MKNLRQHLTYANVMSTIGVFLILGGATAFAAQQLGNKRWASSSSRPTR